MFLRATASALSRGVHVMRRLPVCLSASSSAASPRCFSARSSWSRSSALTSALPTSASCWPVVSCWPVASCWSVASSLTSYPVSSFSSSSLGALAKPSAVNGSSASSPDLPELQQAALLFKSGKLGAAASMLRSADQIIATLTGSAPSEAVELMQGKSRKLWFEILQAGSQADYLDFLWHLLDDATLYSSERVRIWSEVFAICCRWSPTKLSTSSAEVRERVSLYLKRDVISAQELATLYEGVTSFMVALHHQNLIPQAATFFEPLLGITTRLESAESPPADFAELIQCCLAKASADVAYLEGEDWDETLEMYTNATELMKENRDDILQMSPSIQVAIRTYRQLGRMHACGKESELSEKFLKDALKLAEEEENNELLVADCLLGLSDSYKRVGKTLYADGLLRKGKLTYEKYQVE